MASFTVLLDAPAKPDTRIQIARLGDFEDPRYGEFSITPANVASWQKHLSKLPGGEALIDFEHRSERKPRDSKAAGWISGIDLDGDAVMADARWTPGGEKAIQDQEYRFLSPVFGPTQVENETLDDALPSVALTNKPFLASMPAVCLASPETIAAAVEELESENDLRLLDLLSAKQRNDLKTSDFAIPAQRAYPIHDVAHARNALARVAQHGTSEEQSQVRGAVYKRYPELKPSGRSDSRAPMDAPALLSALGIDEDSELAESLKGLELDEDSERTLLDAAQELKDKANKKAPPADGDEDDTKTLDQRAREEGMVILDAEEAGKLRTDAAAGALAMKQLHQGRFDTAFENALNDPKGPRVKPEERDRLQKFFELDADLTLADIAEREPQVPAKPTGRPVIDLEQLDETDPQQVAAAGLHPDAHQLDQKIRKHLQDKELPTSDYRKVLEQVMNGAVVL